MAFSRRLLLVLAIAIFSMVVLQPVFGRLALRGGGTSRHLLQMQTKPCPVAFNTINYSLVTSKCRYPYDEKDCCSPFHDLACQYRAQVDDFSTTCPTEFVSYLNYVGGYPDGIFVDRCITGGKLC